MFEFSEDSVCKDFLAFTVEIDFSVNFSKREQIAAVSKQLIENTVVKTGCHFETVS